MSPLEKRSKREEIAISYGVLRGIVPWQLLLSVVTRLDLRLLMIMDVDVLLVYPGEHGPGYRGYLNLMKGVLTRALLTRTRDMRQLTMVPRNWVRGDVHTNSVEGIWSLLKQSIVGSYHRVSVKHFDAYLDELEWRFNNRNNEYLSRYTLVRLV